MAYVPGDKPSKKKTGKPKKPAPNSQIASAVQQAMQQFFAYQRNLRPGQYGPNQATLARLFPAGQLGPTYTPQQLRQQAQSALQSMFNPRVKQIRSMFERQMQQGSNAIRGYTGTYANRLGEIPIAIANANQQGLQQQAAVGGALADYMRNTGAEISQDLQSRLADANLSQGQIEGTVGNAAQTGFLGSGEVAGLNAASLSRMADEGNAWLKWGQALPGIGILQGQQELGKFTGQLNDAFASQMGDLQSNMSEMGMSLYQNLLDRDMQRRQLGLDRSNAMAGFYSDAQQRALNAALGGSSLMQNWAQMMLERELGLAGLDLERYGIDADIYGTDVAAQSAAADRAAATGPGSADYPGEFKTKEDLRGGLFASATTFFSDGIHDPGNSLPTVRKRVMSFLRGQNSGPFALSQRELEQLRDQIITSLGRSFTSGGSSGTGAPTPERSEGGGGFDWIVTEPPPLRDWVKDLDWTDIFPIWPK